MSEGSHTSTCLLDSKLGTHLLTIHRLRVCLRSHELQRLNKTPVVSPFSFSSPVMFPLSYTDFSNMPAESHMLIDSNISNFAIDHCRNDPGYEDLMGRD